LLLNIPANRDGLLPDPDCASATAFGSEVKRRFGRSLAHTAGSGDQVTLELHGPTSVDTVILQEDIAEGERVRRYRIEGRTNGEWHPVGTGTSIGHKHIQPVKPVMVDALRIVTVQSAGMPMFKNVAIFRTGVPPPSDWDASPQIWAANLVGNWRSHVFALDLTSKIDAAKQYRLRFVPKNGNVTGFQHLVLKLHDVVEPNFIRPVVGKSDELILDITGVAETVFVSGEVEGAPSGEILLQKL
jgi:alpha-L-fucosidase